MSARGAKKGEDRPSHDASKKPAAPESRPDEDDAIEILEVVGVDETTGTPRHGGGGKTAPSPPADPGDEGPHGSSRELREALAEKDKYYDLLLRKQADFENYRKRTEREREELRATVVADLVKRLLPALDNLARALGTAEGSDDALRQGVVLIHQQFVEALRKEGVLTMDTLGARFDPRLHEAVEVLDVDGFEQGVILEEMQKGYTYNDRLLRPALVKVASGRKPKGGGPDPDR